MTPGHVLPRVALALAALGLLVLPIADHKSGFGLFLRRESFPFADELMAAGAAALMLQAFACYAGPGDRLRLSAAATLAFAIMTLIVLEGASVAPGWGLALAALGLGIGVGGGLSARREWAALKTESAEDLDVDVAVWAELTIAVVGVALWFFQIVGFIPVVATVLLAWVFLAIRRARRARRRRPS